MDQLVTFSGMVIRVSNIMPEMREAYFKCSLCSHAATAEIDRGKITEPTLCPECNTQFTFSIIHNRCSFVDRQMIRLQEDLGKLYASHLKKKSKPLDRNYWATLFCV